MTYNTLETLINMETIRAPLEGFQPDQPSLGRNIPLQSEGCNRRHFHQGWRFVPQNSFGNSPTHRWYTIQAGSINMGDSKGPFC